MKKNLALKKFEPLFFLIVFFIIFGALGSKMGVPNMLNTLMNTSYQLLLETVFYIMGITVLSGALGKILVEFGVVGVLEKILRPLMKPLWNLPGVAALGGVLTFLSDNPAIITLANDKNFSKYFKKYQLISITNFGTAFGMGLVVIVFMAGRGFASAALVGLVGAFIGSVISTRIVQRLILKAKPDFDSPVVDGAVAEDKPQEETEAVKDEGLFLRILNSLLDGGKSGVDLGLAIIPGVLIISTFVMMFTFGPGENGYTGAAYEGIALLPALAEKIGFVFEWLFGFTSPELVAFPMTALGAVGAALGLVPTFQESGLIDGNAIAVFTAMGMCWSGYLSTHTAMLDSLGYRELTSKAIIAHTIGGLAAGIIAHWLFVLVNLL
ncbi:MAG: nucleoside recognition domain-containing protein [Bacteroidales bacterium]|nr:nucleoside recognition domain-containing protein [Bacteroidales bacterium]MBQ7018411.1 nucleoside recognition domain-containing protein [Bacteroidales bacterium]